MKTITIQEEYFEHLLASLANQKYINEVNADGLSSHYKDTQRDIQKVIDRAWLDGMDYLNSN